MGLNKREGQKTYAKLLSDGTLRVKCDENDADAVKREYEHDGKDCVVFENKYSSLSGLITSIEFPDSQYDSMNVTILDGEEEIIVTMPSASNFADDLMKRLPNVDVLKSVELRPFAFTDDKGKDRKGITLIQNESKLSNYFYDGDKNINEYPEPEEGTDTKKAWRKYFAGVNEFLIEHTNSVVVPKLPVTTTEVDF